nr:translation initiation factor IF-2 [Oryctolagus cuniculus]
MLGVVGAQESRAARSQGGAGQEGAHEAAGGPGPGDLQLQGLRAQRESAQAGGLGEWDLEVPQEARALDPGGCRSAHRGGPLRALPRGPVQGWSHPRSSVAWDRALNRAEGGQSGAGPPSPRSPTRDRGLRVPGTSCFDLEKSLTHGRPPPSWSIFSCFCRAEQGWSVPSPRGLGGGGAQAGPQPPQPSPAPRLCSDTDTFRPWELGGPGAARRGAADLRHFAFGKPSAWGARPHTSTEAPRLLRVLPVLPAPTRGDTESVPGPAGKARGQPPLVQPGGGRPPDSRSALLGTLGSMLTSPGSPLYPTPTPFKNPWLW